MCRALNVNLLRSIPISRCCETNSQYLKSMEMISHQNRPRIPNSLFFLCYVLFLFFIEPVQAADKPFGISKRVPWTTSRLTASPDPPPPYKIVRAFPKLTFKNALLLTNAPGTERLFVGEQAGKLYSFPNDPEVAKVDLLLD